MKRTKHPEERLPFHDFGIERKESVESVIFVSTIGLICLYLWLILSLWI